MATPHARDTPDAAVQRALRSPLGRPQTISHDWTCVADACGPVQGDTDGITQQPDGFQTVMMASANVLAWRPSEEWGNRQKVSGQDPRNGVQAFVRRADLAKQMDEEAVGMQGGQSQM